MSKTIGTNKKVIYLMEYPIDLPGGAQLSTQTLCEGLVESNKYNPVVVCPELLSKNKEDYPFEIITFRSNENRELSKLLRITNFIKRIFCFYKIVKEQKPDIVHISMSESLITYGAFRVFGFNHKIPFVYTDRGLCYGYRKHSKFCIKQTLKKAYLMVTTTEFNKKLWLEDGIKCPIRVIPNTISDIFEEYEEDKRKAMRNKYGILDDEFCIGFAGRISEEKDWPSVRSIVASIKDIGIKIKVALVLSTYEDRDEQIASEIRQGIVDSIGEDNLIYLQDLRQKDMSDYYYMVDAFVMTSNFESFGKAAVEAMSRKCVVLSTGAGGLPEVIGRNENIYSKSDLAAFADRIKQLALNPELLEAEREYYFNRYRNNYIKALNVKRHIDLYDEITC